MNNTSGNALLRFAVPCMLFQTTDEKGIAMAGPGGDHLNFTGNSLLSDASPVTVCNGLVKLRQETGSATCENQ